MNKVAAVLILTLGLSVGACGPDRIALVQTVRVAPEIPAALRQCKDIPPVPAVGATQRDIALYILDMHEVLEDCKRVHASLVKVIDDFQRRISSDIKG